MPRVLAATLARLIADPALRLRLGRAARTRVLERFGTTTGLDRLAARLRASLRSGRPIPLPPPSKEWERDPGDRSDPTNQARVSFVGSLDTIRRTPLNQIGVAQASAVLRPIIVRQSAERESVDVARFGSFI